MSDESDLCVVGTGPSAFFLVRKYLSQRPDAKVLVLEAGLGAIDPSTPLSNRESNGAEFKLKPTINIGFGGTSQLWHNVLAPLDREDFEHKPWIPDSGWPISRIAIDRFYEEVAEFFGFSFDIFENPSKFCSYDQEINKIGYDKDVFEHKIFVHPSKYLRTDKTFKALAREYEDLSLLQGVVALRFDRSAECSRLLTFNRKTGEKSYISAKHFVLCCGALNNPEILLNSEEIRSSLPQLGRYLMDHPMGNFYQYRYPNKVSANIYSSLTFKKDISLKVALRVKQHLRKDRKLANSIFYLRPSFSEGYNNRTEELKNQLLTVRSKLKSLQIPIQEGIALVKDLNMVAQIIQYKTGLLSGHRLTDCMFVTEQRPSPTSRVLLTDRRNEYGNYATVVTWQVSDQDAAEVSEIKDLIDRYLMGPNRASPTYNASQYDWRTRLSSAAHHLGTVRMSIDEKDGCVDENLKLHGVEDIYVCDGSVFSSSGNANPTMTCMAFGARLGAFLANG